MAKKSTILTNSRNFAQTHFISAYETILNSEYKIPSLKRVAIFAPIFTPNFCFFMPNVCFFTPSFCFFIPNVCFFYRNFFQQIFPKFKM